MLRYAEFVQSFTTRLGHFLLGQPALPFFLAHLATNQVRWDFDDIISVDGAGAFKPHPSVYRRAAKILALEPGECLMVSANSFDVLGARACGFRAAFVNRRGLPYEDSLLQPDLIVRSFTELADALVRTG